MKRRKESDYQFNSDYVIFYEHAGWHCGQPNGISTGTQINVAFLDSHVKTVNITNAPSTPIGANISGNDGTSAYSPAYPNYDETGAINGTPGTFTPNNSSTTYYDPALSTWRTSSKLTFLRANAHANENGELFIGLAVLLVPPTRKMPCQSTIAST